MEEFSKGISTEILCRAIVMVLKRHAVFYSPYNILSVKQQKTYPVKYTENQLYKKTVPKEMIPLKYIRYIAALYECNVYLYFFFFF